ncbi:MAG: asparagine synthase (glutamine-hydrolyzing) [Desulfocapsaceae bacterium]|nr:asparagine synthase (glutamine-hydrolyzing) [Desulfocapsaceae bacterium]
MCGIAGFISQSQNPDLSATLARMAATIAHRGPDSEGVFETVTVDRKHHVGLAHRRLSIIDLSTGHQPLGNEDGSIQIVFNGEIYNFQELRKDLENSGHIFTTNSDTETIVHAYEQWGCNCVQRFRGMFAFAIWDSNQEKLFLARDRFGKKPLFLYESQGALYFASEIKAILACQDGTPTINIQSVYHYLSYRYVPGPETLFSGIRKLPPASVAVWEKGELKEHSYYSPPDRFALTCGSLSDDPVTAFLAKLEESVAMRMVSDVPFGAFLSGGIDSSAIVALMSRHSNLPVKTFSVGFAELQYSELNHATVIAREFNTEHHELIVSQDHLMDELEDLIWFRDAPVAEPSDIPIFLLAKEARKQVKMVLTGEGSDEMLGGYPKHVYERYTRFYQMVPGVVRHHLIEPLVSALPYKFRRVKTAITNLGLANEEERLPRWFGALSSTERSRLTKLGPFTLQEQQKIQFKTDKGNSPLRKILYFDQTSWLPDNLLERGDRMTMAASLEARMPFMDHELAEFASSLPDSWLVQGQQTKRILREAMKQLLPENILKRPKVGFRVPVNEWFQGPMKDYLFDHLTGPGSITRTYYHQKELNKVLEEHVRGRQNHEKLLWTLLTLEIFHRRYKLTP